MRNLVPFAVVGSNSIIEVSLMLMFLVMIIMIMMSLLIMMIVIYNIQDENGRKSRGRSYPWGTVNIEERQHCDFQVEKRLWQLYSIVINHQN